MDKQLKLEVVEDANKIPPLVHWFQCVTNMEIKSMEKMYAKGFEVLKKDIKIKVGREDIKGSCLKKC